MLTRRSRRNRVRARLDLVTIFDRELAGVGLLRNSGGAIGAPFDFGPDEYGHRYQLLGTKAVDVYDLAVFRPNREIFPALIRAVAIAALVAVAAAANVRS